MRILFHLGHPAHFHLFKNVIHRLLDENHIVDIISKEKDVLSSLLDSTGWTYHNFLSSGKSKGKVGLLKDLITRGRKLLLWSFKNRPDLLIGSSVDISYVGKLLNIPSVNVAEDDASAVPLYSKLAYPWATAILSPSCCNNGKWQNKTITYQGYHELAYLHPDLFTADKSIAYKYCSSDKQLFIFRFSGMNAHHDNGVRGINDSIALELIRLLKPHGQIIITSERSLSSELEQYRVSVDPIDMHHLLAFTTLLISDSQTMTAEASVLGTPTIRYNDFVGKIGYLNELEDKYQLTYSFKIDEKDLMLKKVMELLQIPFLNKIFQERRQKMLSDKINVSEYLYKYIVAQKWACRVNI